MMKIIIACVTSLLLVVSTGASARGYGYGNHGYGHGYGYGNHGYGHGYRHRGFGYGGYGYRGFGYGYGGYGYRGGDAAGYLVGGLLIGSLLAPPRYAPPPQVVYVPQTTTTVAPVRRVRTQATVSRRLLRDINGHCFERKIDPAGTELRVELAASECAW